MSFLFPFFFIGIWIFATYIIANMAWRDLVEHYRAPDHVEGKRIGVNSLSINSVNYKNSIVLTYNEVGLYMKPILLFRLFHEPLLIPWTEMRVIRTKKNLVYSLHRGQYRITNIYYFIVKSKNIQSIPTVHQPTALTI